jgi:hypothetical protein
MKTHDGQRRSSPKSKTDSSGEPGSRLNAPARWVSTPAASALVRLLQWVLLARPPHSGEPSYNASLEKVEAFLTTLATMSHRFP